MSFSLLDMRKIQRGDIFTYDFGKSNGSTQTGLRPAVVVQTDMLNRNSPTTIIAPITTSLKRVSMRSHIVLGKNYGLNEESMILLEQMRVVNKADLFEFIGTVDNADILFQIDEGIKSTLGIRTRRYVRSDVKKLCPLCFDKLVSRNTSIIKRIDPFEKKNYMCDICGNDGSRYFLIPKNNN